MCGIAGFWQLHPTAPERLAATARAMAETLILRGPDSEGVWTDNGAGVGLGHRRLAILDLSPSGHQPMSSECGRYTIAFNGEIYNYVDLRKELIKGGHSFAGTSDTEVLVQGIARWGVQSLVGRLNGMFAFAVWDRKERSLTLARDHVGIKPLYYCWHQGEFLFGSELKVLLAYPGFRRTVNRDSLGLLLRYNYIPAPYCIFENCFKLPPGHTLVLTNPTVRTSPEPFWSLESVVTKARDGLSQVDPDNAVRDLDLLLRDAVKLQMVADVPLGAFLSGGIDSSVVVALMQAQSTRRVKTFTIGFSENEFDEARHAQAVARHLGTDHVDFYVTPKEALAVIPGLGAIYDEPLADSSQVPTFLLARLTKRDVTVCLSGDGGDELFAGYRHYRRTRQLWKITRLVPRPIRRLIANAAGRINESDWDARLESCRHVVPANIFEAASGFKLQHFGASLTTDDAGEFYNARVSRWLFPEQVVVGAHECRLPFAAPRSRPRYWRSVDSMAYFDTMNYMPDDVLVKVDRASMAVSLEARVPLLDYRVVQFAAELPLHLKMNRAGGKWILKQLLYKYVPRELVDRRKMGFSMPLAKWLRGPLRDWAEDLLDRRRIDADGFFRSEPILKKWAEHMSGRRDWSRHLWSVLMFQSWKTRWL